jgi:hypothetical protein
MHLAQLCHGINSELPQSVKQKYTRTVELYRKRYPRIIASLEQHEFDFTAIFPDADWASVIKKHPESYSYAIESRVEF